MHEWLDCEKLICWLTRIGLAVACFCVLPCQSGGSVIVVTNRTVSAVSFYLESAASAEFKPREFIIDAGDCVPIPLAEPAQMAFQSAGQQRKYLVAPGGLYYFGTKRDKQLDVGQIALGGDGATAAVATQRAAVTANKLADDLPVPTVVIPVKILYDDAEVLSPALWEARMRKRFDAASSLFRKYCFVEFRIIKIENWHSDPALTRLDDALAEFERVVQPAPARVAIGFTARQRMKLHDQHLGGTRGPLHTHLLLRERVNKNTERECLELLVHELGHFLGAAHSPEQSTVMRTVLGDRQARAGKFRVVFDPLNTMAMCLVSQELLARPEVRFRRMTQSTQRELCTIYVELARAVPNDDAARQFLRWAGGTQLDVQGSDRH